LHGNEASHAIERRIESRSILGGSQNWQHFYRRDIHGVLIMLVSRELRRLVGLTLGIAAMGVPVVVVPTQMNMGSRGMLLWLGNDTFPVRMTEASCLSKR
jgi:hypothetical protein